MIRGVPTVCLLHQARLIQELVALQGTFWIPWRPMQAKRDLGAFPPCLHGEWLWRLRHPRLECWLDGLGNQGRTACPPVLPGKVAIPVVPLRFSATGQALLPYQG